MTHTDPAVANPTPITELLRELAPPLDGLDLDLGDGVDGDLLFDGVSSVLGVAPIAKTYTMTRPIFANDLTVSPGVTVNPNGHNIYARGRVTLPGFA